MMMSATFPAAPLLYDVDAAPLSTRWRRAFEKLGRKRLEIYPLPFAADGGGGGGDGETSLRREYFVWRMREEHEDATSDLSDWSQHRTVLEWRGGRLYGGCDCMAGSHVLPCLHLARTMQYHELLASFGYATWRP